MADSAPSLAATAPASTPASASASSSTSIQALIEARPPATDRFTYLTLIEEHLSPDVLPTLHTVLQDAPLTQELGWDLVDMLVPLLPASEACLDDVARLGNPREVILKVLEVLERLAPRHSGGDAYDFDAEDDGGGGEEEEEEEEEANAEDKEDKVPAATSQAFVALLGMLAILHRRLKTKYPSRFLETTLRTILAAYRPSSPAMTTAVLGLVRALAARRRPAPPIRRSDSQLSGLALAQPVSAPSPAAASASSSAAEASSAIGKVGADTAQSDASDAAASSVPDPEAEDQVAPSEGAIQQRLLQSFVTCVLEAYVNANDLAWAPRLVEFYHPKRVVPGRPTELAEFREDPVKIARDATVSQLVALALDLGLRYSDSLVAGVTKGPVRRRPLDGVDVAAGGGLESIDSISLSTGGVLCLLAYWVFASDVFKGDAAVPNLRVFPDHHAMLETFFDGNAAAQIAQTPGTVDALVALGLWLDHHRLYADEDNESASREAQHGGDDFMPYHHQLTLCAVFHPSLAVRNAATMLAGAVLHANPDAEDRLKILQDLLENCMFASLKACAVTWLREEIVAATAAAENEKTASSPSSLFGGPDAVEQLQYTIFPDLQALQDKNAASADARADVDAALLEYWMQNAPFLLQAANFAYFLFCSDRLKDTVVPPGMGPAIEQRYVEPLLQAARRLRSLAGEEGSINGQGHSHDHDHDHSHTEADPLQHAVLDLDVLSSRLSSVTFS
ncbi:YAP1-binding protein 1 [Sporothrix curviconia]|uniref:YAP1-binding protein 1 n=1 Tax=Sporothrix curviconia TaxID=1260050 RepID=A0ABP0B7M1_9PEZI